MLIKNLFLFAPGFETNLNEETYRLFFDTHGIDF